MDDTAEPEENSSDGTEALCADTVGGGCAGVPFGRPECLTEAGDGDSGTLLDTDDTGVTLEGGACSVAPVQPASWTLVALWLLVRRLPWLVVLMVALPAHAVDVQTLQRLDGGPWFGLQRSDIGENGALHFSLSSSVARNPVMERINGERTAIIPVLGTFELAGSVAIRGIRLGAAVPAHVLESGPHRGDLTMWSQFGMPESAGFGELSIRMALDLRPANGHRLLSQSGVRLSATGSRALGGWTLGYDAGVIVQGTDVLPGLAWSWRGAGGVGLRRAVGPVEVSSELLASVPLRRISGLPGNWPLESLTGVSVLTDVARVGLAGGLGVTRGVGAPAWRIAATVDLVASPPIDRDGDGIVFPRDLCPIDPEDIDGFRDRDGCPEDDNDRDGFTDTNDVCPNDAEVFNGINDTDGCPDSSTRITLTVESIDGAAPEVADVRLSDVSTRLLQGEALRAQHVPGPAVISVSAPGFEPVATTVMVPETRDTWPLTVTLRPQRLGTLTVQAVDPDGSVVPATVTIGNTQWTTEDGPTTLKVGELWMRVHAPRFVAVEQAVRVETGEHHTVQVVLTPLQVSVDNNIIKTSEPLRFAIDAVSPNATDHLDLLADWLRSRPDIRLLRVEGYADALGASAYNYDLSQRRADGVRDALIERGIAPERLVAIAAGEARQQDAPERQVSFLVLIWDDE